jgi:hypothetical protein
MAPGGSTNAIIHVAAMARRAGIALSLEQFDQISRTVPVIANIRPSGKYLMEDFFYAGGLPAVMKMLGGSLAGSCLTVNGRTVAQNIERAEVFNADVIRPLDKSIYAEGATAVLRGNLAPRGAVMKPSAAEPRLRKHRGKALVFRDYDHMAAEVERDDLDVTPDHVLVLQNAGPKGGPGMPEWGMLPIPRAGESRRARHGCASLDATHLAPAYGARIRTWRRRASWADHWHSFKPATRSKWMWASVCLAPARLRRGAGRRRAGRVAAPAPRYERATPCCSGAYRPGRRRVRLSISSSMAPACRSPTFAEASSGEAASFGAIARQRVTFPLGRSTLSPHCSATRTAPTDLS